MGVLMSPKTSVPSGYVKKENLILAVCIAFALGFFGGIVLTVYKSGPSTPTPKASAKNGGNQKMVEALVSETKQNPGNAGSWIQLGNTYFDSSQYQKAIEAYEKALAITPENANVQTDLGVMYRRNKQPRKAIAAFERAIAADPRHEVSRLNKGIVLLHDLNDSDGAIKAWEALIEVNPLAMAPNGQSVDALIQQYKQGKAAGKPKG
jgi:cytochrome c-type biogenesis protein CcmH/NrfG